MMKDPFAETVELIRSARAGDAGAFGAVVARYRRPLLDRIRLMMGAEARGAAESSDFVQGLFLEIVRDFGSLRGCDERSFLRWATALARNNIRDAVRRQREHAIGNFASSLDWRPANGNVDRPAPSEMIARQEQVDGLVEAMTALPEDYQRVIELRHFDALSFAEIGALMQRSDNAAQILHHRALIQLGELLRASQGG